MQQLFKEQQIPVSELERVGLAKNGRINLKQEDLNALLAGGRTAILRLENFEQDGLKIINMDAKLSLQQNEQGGLDLLYHPVYRDPLQPAFLSQEEAEKLIDGEIANLDKVVIIDGQQQEVLIEFDRDTNEFVITDSRQILAPDLVNNEQLTPDQKRRFIKGKEVELTDGTKFQFSNTDNRGIRANKLHLIASIIIDGGLSYFLFKGLHALAGEKHDKVSEDYSRGYYHALEDMQIRQTAERVNDRSSILR